MIEKSIKTLSVRYLTIKSATYDNQLSLLTTVDRIFKLDDGHLCEDYFQTRTSVYDHNLADFQDGYEPSVVSNQRFDVELPATPSASTAFYRNALRKATRAAYADHADNQEIYDTLRC